MNKFTKLLFVLGLLLGSVIIYAINAEKTFTNYLLGGFLSTRESEEVLHTSKKETAVLLAASSNVVFSDDFEGTASSWTFISGTANPWFIGTAAKNTGTKGLYITNDNGVTNAYSNVETVNHAVSKSIAIAAGTKEAELRFDWRAEGEGTAPYVYDYLDVWIIPSTYTPVADTKLDATSSGGVAVKVNMNKQKTFKTEIIPLDLSKFAGKSINIVFEWENDYDSSYPPAAAIDNVELSVFPCTSVDGFKEKANTKTSTSIEVEWTLPTQAGKSVELYISDSATPPTASTVGVATTGNTHKFNTLKNNTPYYIWNRPNCSSTEVGGWKGPLMVRTLCGIIDLPFWEGFNSDSSTSVCWTIKDENKDATSATSNGIWKTSTTAFEGSHSMYFYGSTTDKAKLPHNDWLITPVFKYNPNKTYRLKYHYRTNTTSSYDYEFEVLLSDKGGNTTDFTKVIVPKKKYPASNGWVEEYVFFTGVTADFQLAWHVTSATSSTYLYIDNVFVEEVAGCLEPIKLAVSNLTDTSATLSWTDASNSSWEYYVQEEGIGAPIATQATSTTQKTATITQDNGGTPLAGNTVYEYYVRSSCAAGQYSMWAGPFQFTTKCSPITALPFEEGFNTNSSTYDCWTIVDNKPNSTTASNTWRRYDYSMYEGDRVMYFSYSGTPNDDWLISPTFTLTGGVYEVSYYYKTSATTNTEYEVLLSTAGVGIDKFTTTLMAKKKVQVGNYTKAVHYINGVTGNVNVAIHIASGGSSTMYLDKFSIEKVNCIAPDQKVDVTNVTAASATLTWTDAVNSSWEYAVVAASAPAPTTGSSTNNKTVTPIQTTGTGATPLQPNTDYDFYVRSSCGGANRSKWVGPIRFRTLCSIYTAPYWEGFNSDSTSIDCWSVEDLTSPDVFTSEWTQYPYTKYEGTHALEYEFWDLFGESADTWLISPTFSVAANKYYSLRFHYRTIGKLNMEVLSSTKGSSIADFTTKLITKKDHSLSSWKEERITISSKTAGSIAFAWHITSEQEINFYIDNVFFEEIDCPEPYNLNVTNITDKSATLNWTEDFGSNWEYLVQNKGMVAPVATDKGITTTTKTANITATNAGVNLKPNTEYEYYVRTICDATNQSVWIGPFVFRTNCGVYDLPFWEGFNADSETTRCWGIVDGNGDATSATSAGIWRVYSYNGWFDDVKPFEGTHAMYFYGSTTDKKKLPHNDWLISPRMKYTLGKIYRLKYHYQTAISGGNEYEFEVLLSDKGDNTANFTKVVVPKKKYTASDAWVEEYVFFSGVTADFQLAWHVTSATNTTYLNVDNVFIEEVEGCAEPLPSSLGVKDIGKKEATLFWDDKQGGIAWEYYVQEAGGAKPSKTDKGTATSKKEVIATKDGKGNNLKGNTDYEFYVRTDCGNGVFSIWSGPFKFTTLCDFYDTPFWEGFNSNAVQYRCWSTMDNAGVVKPITTPWSFSTSAYEGDRAVYFSLSKSAKTPYDDWLISPEIDLDGGQYILKYHYKTNTVITQNPEFEVVLSTNGIDAKEFKKVLVPSSIKREGDYVEEVVFFNGVKGKVHIAWHVNAKDTQYSYLYLDNINLKKVATCPEPYAVKTSNHTGTTVDVSWSQVGGITNWDVIVVPYKEPATATPIKTVQVSGNPSTTITGLATGTLYTVYVIAKCDATLKSDVSTGADFGTKMGGNTNCQLALVIPVTNNSVCEKTVSGSLFGAVSTLPAPLCSPNLVQDAWFEFTATATAHMLTISDLVSLSKQALSVNVALYDQPCAGITGPTARECFRLSTTTSVRMIRNLVVGQKYFIRVGVAGTVANPDLTFKLCLNTPKYIDVTSQPYTPEQLVKEVLVVSDCDLVSNVTARSGHDFGDENGIGYFTNKSNLFPFKEGIVLATNGRQYTAGPTGGNQGFNSEDWLGDDDLDALLVKNGQYDVTYNASVLEFDFTSIVDNISFNFLFASDEYGVYQCDLADVFAFFLTDLTTGEMINIAVVPDTNIPVSVVTIRDEQFNVYNGCESQNEEYFGYYFDDDSQDTKGQAKARELNPISYKGMTIPMVAKSKVVPGRKYHMKLAIANYQDTAYQSAVFLEGGSFNLGSLDLGADLTIDNGTALCNGEAREINSGLVDDPAVVRIEWYKDGVLIEGENKPILMVSETGTYKVVGHYNDISCDIEGEIYVEIFPPIHEVVNKAIDLSICRFTTETTFIDLTKAIEKVFEKKEVNAEHYRLVFFEDALATVEIETPEEFELDHREERKIYYKITDLRSKCEEVFTFSIKPEAGEIPEKPKDVSVCESYALPAIAPNQMYYTQAGGLGTAYKGGDVLGVGVHELFLFQDNGDFCYEEVAFKVEVTERIVLKMIADQVMECEVYELPELPEHNHYFIEVEGQRVPIMPKTPINQTNTRVYIVAESPNKVCYDETSFVVTYNDCPIPKGFSPNGDGVNDRFDLSNHGVVSLKVYNRNGTEVYSFKGLYTDQWDGKSKSGSDLPSGTYYYVIQAYDKTRTGWVQLQR